MFKKAIKPEDFTEFSFCKNNFYVGKKTSSVAITDSSDVRCFDLGLINIFTNTMKTKRCTEIMFTLTLSCYLCLLKIQTLFCSP